MLADCLTKTMDSSVLRECLRTGKYSLFDEDQVLKQRADGRQRLKWIREHQNGTTETSEVLNDAEQEQACLYVQKTEPKDFWCLGPGKLRGISGQAHVELHVFHHHGLVKPFSIRSWISQVLEKRRCVKLPSF